MAVIAGNHPAQYWPGVKKWFGVSYNERPEQWKDLLDVTDSDKAYEERILSNSFNLLKVKDPGRAVTYEADSQGYTSRIENIAYALGFIITREELDFNQYRDKAFDRAAKLAFSARITKEIVGANIYNNAFNAAFAGGDGVNLLDTAHPTVAGDQSNVLSPAADLSELALEDLAIQIMGATDFNGKKIALRPYCLSVPTALCFDAERILMSDYQSGTGNNDLNALRAKGVFPDGIKVNQFLTDPKAYFIRTEVPKGTGMIYQESAALELQKDNDFDTMNAKALAYMRFGVGWADWHGLYGSPGV